MKQVVIPDYARKDGTPVRGSTYIRDDEKDSSNRAPGNGICKRCGAEVFFVPMRKGWGVFDGEAKSSGVIHPCFDRGNKCLNEKGDRNYDLFEDD